MAHLGISWLKVLLENEFPVDKDYMNENEYTISGYNFRILNISKEDNYYLVDVEPFTYWIFPAGKPYKVCSEN